MSGLIWLTRTLLVVVATILVSGCSKTVTWEEEVPLNTGETIWVTKVVNYSIKGQPDNPADLSYLPDEIESTSFMYRGKHFEYVGNANVILLAISPDGIPVLLAVPENTSWYRHNQYECVIPYYVQLSPDSTGRQWSWPKRISSWTHNLPVNLLGDRPPWWKAKARYSVSEKATQQYLRDPQLTYIQKIDPAFTGNACNGSNKK